MRRVACLMPVLALLAGCGSSGSSGYSDTILEGVACASARLCVAVGTGIRDFASVNLAESWDGRGWRTETVPGSPPNGGGLRAVSCLGDGRCVAVGNSYAQSSGSVPLAKLRTGGRWAAQPVAELAGAQLQLADVSCSGSACTAVGEADHSSGASAPLAERWDGARWTLLSPPIPPSSIESKLSAVSCPAVSWCAAVGGYGTGSVAGQFAERWNGRQWSIDRIGGLAGPEIRLLGISCASPDACMAVGTSQQRTLAVRWDGQRWAVTPTPNLARGALPNGALVGVSCPEADDCTAVGYYRRAGDGYQATCKVPECSAQRGVDQTLSMHWDGASWAIQPTPDGPKTTSSVLYGVACPTRGLCIEVGSLIAREP